MNQKFKQTEIGKFLAPSEQVVDLTDKFPATSNEWLGKRLGEKLGENHTKMPEIILENKHISVKELSEKIGISTPDIKKTNMFLKVISLFNFRGIDKLEKLEVFNLNTLVGKNDSGKSIILFALDRFFNEKRFDAKDIFKGKKEKETTSIELSFAPSFEVDNLALDKNGLISIKKEFFVENEKVKCNAFYLANDFIEKEYQDLWNKKEQDLNQIIENLGEKSINAGRGNKNVLKIKQINGLLVDKKRQNIYHPLGDFLKNLEKEYNITLPEYSLFDAERDLDVGATNFQSQFKPIISVYFEDARSKTNELEDKLKEELSSEFEEIRKFMIKNVSGLKKINPTTEFDWSKSLKKFDLNLEFDNEEYDVPISHKGTGFKRLLMVAYFEYLASKKNVSDQIFSIEEPETYLHPSAQENLLGSIIKISEKYQFFITTHSPIFAGATRGESSILVTKNEQSVSQYSRGDNIISQIIHELGIRPDYNLLKNIKFLIFVEGKDDIQFLQIATKALLNKDIENDRILCVIGGGSSLKNSADLDLFKKLSPGNKYAVLVDGDGGNEREKKWKQDVEQRCKTDGAIFHKLSKREIENYCCPQKIKHCYIRAIKDKKGEQTPNLKISEIENLNIEILDTTDVEKYLANLGLSNFKKGINIEVFKSMNENEWKTSDNTSEIKNFIDKIYAEIQK